MKFQATKRPGSHDDPHAMIENPATASASKPSPESSDDAAAAPASAPPASTQSAAIAQLLRDDDPETVRLVRDQLAQGGEALIPELQKLARLDDTKVAGHARSILEEMTASERDDELLLFCYFFPTHGDFETAWTMISHALGGTSDFAACEHKLTQWGRRFQVALAGKVSDRERVLALVDFMAGELSFRGNTDHYYCERNSLLPEVINRRTGIPLTLTLLYMMVGQRAGMKIDGMNLPGHFVARHGDVLFDPFHKGRILTRDDCSAILAKQNLTLRSGHLRAATPRQIVLRILANLLYIYDLHQETEKHSRVHTWMKALLRDDC